MQGLFSKPYLDNKFKGHTHLLKQYKVTEDYFFSFLTNFVEVSPVKSLCSHVLYHSASEYADKGEINKTTTLIHLLKKKHADKFYVGQGHADKILARLKLIKGSYAPDFAAVTLDGKTLKLSELKGKYVFLDFWGTWCGPCVGELPNIKALAKAIDKDKLQVIGLADDDEETLRAFFKGKPVPYDNVVAPEAALKVYGITKYPTTFLIDPIGKICDIDLRGHGLTNKVQEIMGL